MSFFLWPNIRFSLENVTRALEKNSVVGRRVLQMSIRSGQFIVLLKSLHAC